MVTKRTIDTIVGPGKTIKTDYYMKIPSAPCPIEPMYYTLFKLISKAYQGIKYTTEFVYNILVRK